MVVVHLRHKGKGRKRRLVTSKGFVIAIDSRDPNRVKTDRCPEKFRKVLEIKRHSTSMISNDTQSQIRTLDFLNILLSIIINVCKEKFLTIKLAL